MPKKRMPVGRKATGNQHRRPAAPGGGGG